MTACSIGTFDCGTVIPFHGIINFYDYDKPPGDPKFGYDQQVLARIQRQIHRREMRRD